jgi:tRNA 2-selenouridine synthase
VAWLLDLYGFEVCTLVGGYKAYRNWVLGQFEKQYDFKVIGGYTGSGKTEVLKKFARLGELVLDLEGIANHKGSAFGGFDGKQPSQEMFDNLLAMKLSELDAAHGLKKPIWIEDESQRIGLVNVPTPLWSNMKKSDVYFLEVPFDERLAYLTRDYGKYSVELLVNAVIRIQKRLGGVDTKQAVNHILEGNVKEGFRVLLLYYDKFYLRGIKVKELAGNKILKVPCLKVDEKQNAINILDKFNSIGAE